MDWGQGVIAFATADYGTKFVIVAGLLNFMRSPTRITLRLGRNSEKAFSPQPSPNESP